MSRTIPEKLRRLVVQRANSRCEYCQLPDVDAFYTFPIDHIISVKHGGTTTADNLAYACMNCNTHKGSDIGTMLLPNRQLVRLFNPREDIWSAHFELSSGVLYAKTLIGEATLKVLKMNEIERIIERQDL